MGRLDCEPSATFQPHTYHLAGALHCAAYAVRSTASPRALRVLHAALSALQRLASYAIGGRRIGARLRPKAKPSCALSSLSLCCLELTTTLHSK